MSLWKIYRVFAEMGAVCVGGGYAMLSLVQRVVVEEHGWATEEELMDYYAIGQCTPGVIAVNVSTFIGHKLRGLPGAIAASLGLMKPREATMAPGRPASLWPMKVETLTAMTPGVHWPMA